MRNVIKLPHLRDNADHENEAPFETIELEMARVHAKTHPHYDEADIYGNKAPQPLTTPATTEPETDDAEETTDAS